MSRVDFKVQMRLLKEAKKLEKNVKPVKDLARGNVLLTEEHIMEWLEVFYEDRIMLDGCNHDTVKR